MDEVPLKTIKFGKWLKCSTTQPSCCFLSCSKFAPLLEFAWRSDSSEDDESTVIFQCGDISAVDLRVETKFGSIDSMKGTIIVECLSPILVQNVHSDNVSSSTAKDVNKVVSGAKNFIIEATFHVNETEAVRNIIRQLRSSCSGEESKSNVENDESTKVSKPKMTTIKEGLPDWVRFIPHSLYSRRTRRSIELAIFLYMIFSVTWALWQLYRYVDFIRELLTPLIDLLQYQYQLLDNLVHLFNTIFEKYTTQWLCFIKPLYTVGTTLAAPLWKILGQLSPLLFIILQSLKPVWDVLKPVAKPIFSIGYQFVQFTCTIFRSIKILVARFWSPFYKVLVPAVKRVKFVLRSGYYRSLYQAHHFDPLKAQLSIVRTTVISSAKALGQGTAHLFRQIYKVIWLRRSARTHKEE